jgi:transposase
MYKLREWLDQHLPVVVKQSAIGKAMHYLNKQWPKLIVYTQDGRLHIDNNLCENAIRPFVIGRKNSLFSDSVRGAKASANLYSLIETAKANGIEPYGYLKRVFTELPQATCVEDVEALLPYTIEASAETAA